MALLPFDYISRLVKGKSHFPPLHLRRYVGPVSTFEASGTEFMSHLRQLAGLQPTQSLLDVGCGCGLMALFLKDYLDVSGHYTGVDIHLPSIRWCQKNIGTLHRNFHFRHIDVRSTAYNPDGVILAEDYRFPFEDQSFDVVLLKSVFTHMGPLEVKNYLNEVARLLKTGGRSLVTFFLLNEEQAGLAREGKQTLKFDFGAGVWRYVYENSPESAVAYDESHIRELISRCGLRLESISYGTWSGRPDGLSFQDMLLLKKSG